MPVETRDMHVGRSLKCKHRAIGYCYYGVFTIVPMFLTFACDSWGILDLHRYHAARLWSGNNADRGDFATIRVNVSSRLQPSRIPVCLGYCRAGKLCVHKVGWVGKTLACTPLLSSISNAATGMIAVDEAGLIRRPARGIACSGSHQNFPYFR